MKKNLLKKYLIIVAVAFLQLKNATIKAETWVNLPYPDDIASQLKNEDNKKVDLDADPLYLGSLNELFENANTDAIIVAAFATEVNNKITISYENPLAFLNDFFKNVPGNQKVLITKKTYDQLKRTYKQQDPNYQTGRHGFTTHILQQHERFTTSDEDDLEPFHAKSPYFVNPFDGLIIKNIYFFKITRTQENNAYRYKAEDIGHLNDIVTSADKIAHLQRELVNNFEGDANAKIAEFKNIIKKYKDANEKSIADALENLSSSPEEKKNRLEAKRLKKEAKQKAILKEAVDTILRDTGSSQLQHKVIRLLFDDHIQPLDTKISLQTFQEIIDKKSNIFADQPNIILNLMNDYAPLIDEYKDNKNETIEALYAQLITIMYSSLPKFTRNEKKMFISNLKNIKTTNEALELVIKGIIETYIKEEKERITKTQFQIKNAQSGNAATKIFDQELLREDASVRDASSDDIIQIYINKDNNPFAAFQFIEDNALSPKEFNQAINQLIKTAKQRLLSLKPYEEDAFIEEFKKIGSAQHLFKGTIDHAINTFMKERETQQALGQKSLLNLAQALQSI